MAQLYHFFPGRDWLHEPSRLSAMMLRSLPAILAEREMAMVRAVRAAMWAKEHELSSYGRRLERAMETREETPAVPTAVQPANEQAREWFRRNGIPMIEA